jgi:RIO-like serine/threonine protein kinase
MSANSNPTQNEKIEAYLRSRRGEWVPMPTLAKVARCFAVNSRAANIREKLQKVGLTVKNRKEYHGRTVHSFYRIEKLES